MAKRTGRNNRSQSTAITAPADRDARKNSTIFLPDHLDQVRAIAMRGLTDDEMAEVFGITPELMASWKAYYPSFAEAIAKGRTSADAEVVRALFKNCVGYDYEEDRVTKDGDVVSVKVRKNGETGAQKYWLNNRDPENWGDKVQVGGDRSPGAVPVGIRDETKMEVMNSILNLITPKADPA